MSQFRKIEHNCRQKEAHVLFELPTSVWIFFFFGYTLFLLQGFYIMENKPGRPLQTPSKICHEFWLEMI